MTIRVDRAFLAQHASYTADGVEERALHVEIGDDRCFALLYRPTEPRDLGFVVCHSYGLELLTLRRVERGVARTLAAMGYPVLAMHRRGYGDSMGSLADATLERHMEDTRAAAERLSAEAGTSRLGLIGARFGGLLAGLAAREGGVDRLVMMNPALRGRDYLRQLIREMHMVQVAISAGRSLRTQGEIVEELQRTGMVDVLGHPIYRRLFDALTEADLTKDMGAFRGEALLFQISKRPTVDPGLTSLRDRIRGQGGRCEIEFVKEPPGAMFGSAAFVGSTGSTSRVDVQAPIVEELSRMAEGWMSR
ncbi:MAG: serine aminopeptidase domain-containing protein [Actinomycetota bacterium]